MSGKSVASVSLFKSSKLVLFPGRGEVAKAESANGILSTIRVVLVGRGRVLHKNAVNLPHK